MAAEQEFRLDVIIQTPRRHLLFYATCRFRSSIEKYSATSSASQSPRAASSRMPFVIYRVILGLVVMGLLTTGVLTSA